MSHKKSSFAKLALFFGFGDSSAASRPPPASPSPLSPAGAAVGLAFVASMCTDDVAAVKAAALLTRSDSPAGATRGQKRGILPPSLSKEGMDQVEVDEQQRRGARTPAATISNKRSRQHEGGFGRVGDNDGVTVLIDLLPRPSTKEAQLVAEFLRRCFGCKKELEGRDIYMYQGDKAFCSEECRYEKMELDEMTSRKHLSGGVQGREPPDESLI